MVAYSFKRRFVAPIRLGLTGNCPMDEFRSPRIAVSPKRQTIRADRRRHARTGEELQLYCGMRTKGCFLIGRAQCVSIDRIRIRFACAGRPKSQIKLGHGSPNSPLTTEISNLDDFARNDGFANWQEMREFWRVAHDVHDFDGVIIKWEPLP